MNGHLLPRVLSDAARRDLRILLIARHAQSDGSPDAGDGTHATYHCEMRRTLEEIGVRLQVADCYRTLFEQPEVDFVFPLLNRGGFLNSEMLLPLLCERHAVPYLGASPILRGLADDKHLTKLAARAHGLPTAPWTIYRRGAPLDPAALPPAARHVVKPNASSASWGVTDACGWAEVREAVCTLQAAGHDAIVEPFIVGHDVEVSVITLHGKPLILPTQIVEQESAAALRSYDEKRDLSEQQSYRIRALEQGDVLTRVEARARNLMREFIPFDYGRFEFRLDVQTGEPLFMEVNLNCNLWSRKTIALAARQIGWNHRALIETILTEGLERHGLLANELHLAA